MLLISKYDTTQSTCVYLSTSASACLLVKLILSVACDETPAATHRLSANTSKETEGRREAKAVRWVQRQVVCVKLTSATSQPSDDQPELHFIDGRDEIISLGD